MKYVPEVDVGASKRSRAYDPFMENVRPFGTQTNSSGHKGTGAVRKDSVSMTELCCCPPEAGNDVCDLPAKDTRRTARARNDCPECGRTGKPVQGQTVKALLSATLREVREIQYFFCRTQTCPVVYFSTKSEQIFTVEEIRERVYQKEPEAQDVFICYCFRHTVGDLRAASPEERIAIVADIDTGINLGQCACDLRNPQGSCCLGNVRARIKQLKKPAIATT